MKTNGQTLPTTRASSFAGARLVVVDLTNDAVVYDDLVPEGRLVAFDGATAYLDKSRAVDIATGRIDAGRPPADTFQINDQLVLQVPGGPEVAYDVAAASSPRSDTVTTTPTTGSASPWVVTVRSHSDAAIDLDGLGVTTAGVGPYVLGAPIQEISDTAGHDLVSTASDANGCAVAAVDTAQAVTTDDMSLVIDDDRLVRLDFGSERFSFDGLGVGSSVGDITRRFPDATLQPATAGSTNVDVLIDDPGGDGIDVVFSTNDGVVSSFRIGSPLRVTQRIACS